MKTSILMLAIIMGMGLFSCNEIDTSFDPVSNDNQRRMSKADRIMTSETWNVVFFWNAGEETTGAYGGFKFKFSETGKVVAINDTGSMHEGTWFTTSTGQKVTLKIRFIGEDGGFENFNREWIFSAEAYPRYGRISLTDFINTKTDSYYAIFEKI